MTENLSMGGVLLKTHSSVPKGSDVNLRLALPSDIARGGELCLLCRGRVVRRVETPKTAIIAIEFSSYHVVLKSQNQVGDEP